jgi:alanine racemase
MAIGAMQAVRERGLEIGKDFAITGFDDAPMVQYLNPPLTSVRQPIAAVGFRIIPMLLELVETGHLPDPFEVLVEPQLMVRASTTGLK